MVPAQRLLRVGGHVAVVSRLTHIATFAPCGSIRACVTCIILYSRLPPAKFASHSNIAFPSSRPQGVYWCTWPKTAVPTRPC
eukprot:98578-Prymnesium_polylepis.1